MKNKIYFSIGVHAAAASEMLTFRQQCQDWLSRDKRNRYGNNQYEAHSSQI